MFQGQHPSHRFIIVHSPYACLTHVLQVHYAIRHAHQVLPWLPSPSNALATSARFIAPKAIKFGDLRRRVQRDADGLTRVQERLRRQRHPFRHDVVTPALRDHLWENVLLEQGQEAQEDL